MKYCPECEAEYLEGVEVCADCEVALIPEEEFLLRKSSQERQREFLTGKQFVSVKLAESVFEAERVKGALEQEGIPVVVRTFQDTAFDGLYVAQKGWGNVEVPESDRARAERIVKELGEVFPEPVEADSDAGEAGDEGGSGQGGEEEP